MDKTKAEKLIRQAIIATTGQAAEHIKTDGNIHRHSKEAEEIEDWCVGQIMAIISNYLDSLVPEKQPLQDPEEDQRIRDMRGFQDNGDGTVRALSFEEKKAKHAISPSILKQMGFNKAIDQFNAKRGSDE